MSGQLGSLVVSLSADVARFREDMGKAVKISNESARTMANAMGAVEGAINGIGKGFAVVTAALAGGAAFGDMISTTKNVTGEIVKLKLSLGITAEEASVMRVALDDVFLTAEDMTGAASRITKQLANNEDAFKRLGVATRDSNGNFRSTTEIMTETNSKLLEFQEGTDRNVEGIKIYGKGWDEARRVLKLTAEAMDDGKKRAKELNLVIGEEGLKAVKEYKKAMKDIEDVSESLKVQLGTALIPELTRMAVVIGGAGANAIPSFISGIHEMQAEVTRLGMLLDKTGGTLTTVMHYLSGGKFTDAGNWWKEQNQIYEQRYKDSEKALTKLAMLEVGLDENGNPLGKGKDEKKSDKKSLGGNDTLASDRADSIAKWLAYNDAFHDRVAAQVKSANDLELELNRQAYAWGLTDLDTYLNKKNDLTIKSLAAEADAKHTALVNAQEAMKKAESSAVFRLEDGRKVRDYEKESANRADAYKKEEDAQKAYLGAVAKLAIEKEKMKDSDREAFYQTTRGYQEQQAALAEYQGDLVRAAEIRKALDESSHARKQLEINATMGEIEAQKALTAQILMDGEKLLQAAVSRKKLIDDLKLSTPDVFGNSNEFGKRQQDLEISVGNVDAKMKGVTELEVLQNLEDQKTAIIAKARAEQAAIQQRYDNDMTQSQFAAAQKATEIMLAAAGDSKAAQLAALAIQTTIAVAQIQIAGRVAQMMAMAQLGPIAGLAMAGQIEAMMWINTGLTVAAGAVKAMNIAGKREAGGPVAAGSTYLIGEKGPELFTPGSSGMITPNSQISGGGITIEQHFNVTGVAADIIENTKIVARQAADRAKAEILNSMNRGGEFALASGRIRQ